MNESIRRDGDLVPGMAQAPARGRSRHLRLVGWSSLVAGLVLAIALAGLGLFVWSIQREKNSAFLREQFLRALQSGLGPGNELVLNQAGMQVSGAAPVFSISGLSIQNPESGAEAELAKADFAITRGSLFRLSPEAKSIRFEGLRLVLPSSSAKDSALGVSEALTFLRAALPAMHFIFSGQDPAFSALSTIEGRDIALYRREAEGGVTLIQDALSASVTRESDDRIAARIRRGGMAAGLDIVARVTSEPDGGRSVVIESRDVPIRNLADLIGLPLPQALDPATRLAIRITSRVSRAKLLEQAGLSVSLSGGRIAPPDPDMTPFQLDEARLDLQIDPATRDILIDQLLVRFNEVWVEAGGRITGDPETGGARVVLDARRVELDRLSPMEPVLALDRARLEGTISRDFKSFALSALDIGKGVGSARLAGTFSLAGAGLVETALEAGALDLREALRIWPVWVAPAVRKWLVDHAHAGRLAKITLRSRLEGAALRDAIEHRPIPDEALAVSYRLEEVTLRPTRDAPLITLNAAAGAATGRRTSADIDGGWLEPASGQRLEILPSKLAVANTAARPAILDLSIQARGHLNTMLAVLAAPSLRDVTGLPPDLVAADGQIEGRLQLAIPLSRQVAGKDVRFEVRADLRRVVIDNLIKGERLDQGNFALTGKSGSVLIKGDARLFGTPAQVEFRADAGKPAIATAKATLDDAALARRGLDLRPALAGPVLASMSVHPGRAGPQSLEIELDLVRARIESGIAGISKKAGQPGRAKFSVNNRPEGAILDNIEVDFGPVSARGRIEMTKDGALSKAEFGTIRFSPGDNAKLAIERARNVTRLSLRGNSFDLRPFLRGFLGGRADDTKSADFDLDLQTTVLVGFNSELASAAEAKIARRSGKLTQFSFKGQFSGAPATATILEQTGDSVTIRADSQDGGALVRFLDIYSRAFGGRATGDVVVKAGSQYGIVQMRDFVIRGEPGLRQFASSGRAGTTLQTNDDVPFTKLRAEFTRSPGRLELHEAVMWGGQVGGTMEGNIDYAADTVSLRGTFVPAYGLNNLFAQVPLLGPLLGGGQYEGLFAVAFIITGKASAPVLRTNPVGALAPGFLRKLFEIQKDEPSSARPRAPVGSAPK